MSFVDKFRSHFGKHQDFSKTSRYEVMIFSPEKLTKYLASPEGLRFQCETAELPGYNINTVERRIYGAPAAVAINPVYNDLSLTFICAGDLWEKKYFDDWMDFIVPKGQYNHSPQYREDYVSTFTIKSYSEMATDVKAADTKDQTGMLAMETRIYGVFPTSVAPISLSWAGDDVNRLSVTFKYKSWERIEKKTQ